MHLKRHSLEYKVKVVEVIQRTDNSLGDRFPVREQEELTGHLYREVARLKSDASPVEWDRGGRIVKKLWKISSYYSLAQLLAIFFQSSSGWVSQGATPSELHGSL